MGYINYPRSAFLSTISERVKPTKNILFENMHEIDPNFIFKQTEFDKRLDQLIKSSKHVSIITLYLGTEEYGENLLKKLANTENTVIHVDMFRSLREVRSKWNMDHYLKDLCITQTDRNMYTNNSLGLLMYAKHSKVYIFDDTILITGTNFFSNFFENTFYRLMEIKSKKLCVEVLSMVCRFESRFTNHIIYLDSLIENNDSSRINNDIGKTYIKPFSEEREFEILKYIIECADDETIYFSTGYLNPPDKYLELFKTKNVKIFAPDLNSNEKIHKTMIDRICGNFHNLLYTFIYEKILGILNLYVFKKDGEVFHMKGVWLFKDGFGYSILGSSNFNGRSYRRDSELNFLLVSSQIDVVEKLKTEVEIIEKYSKRYSGDFFDRNWYLRLIFSVLLYFLSSFL